MKKFSICIPAYNRPNQLDELLKSIIEQDFTDYEIVIAEDFSPERIQISQVVQKYKNYYPEIQIRYHENECNLGYDNNYRRLIDISSGEYCFFMGNDDLVCDGGLRSTAEMLDKYENVGVVIRSYAKFNDKTKEIEEIYKYSDKELYFSFGSEAVAYAFRRSVFMSGMVYHRELAKKFHIDIFDGTLLYQLYLVTQILKEKCLVLTRRLLYCIGQEVFLILEFRKKKGKFTPRDQTVESSFQFQKA